MNNPVTSSTKPSSIIECRNLSQYFDDAGKRVDIFKDLSFDIKAGQRVAITGASGAGKSTLLYLLGGLEKPKSGSVIINGCDIQTLSANKLAKFRNHNLGFVYQFHHLLPEFSALENVAMPLLIRGDSSASAKQKANDLLAKVGLAKRVNHKPSEMSGGERQRTAIARALATNPKCLLADEPTGNLDQRTASQVFDLLVELNEELNTALIIVTHDEHMAASMQRQLILSDGKVNEA